MQKDKKKGSAPCLLYLVVLFAFALRLVGLGHLGLWGDEAWGLYLNRLGLVGLTLETAPDMHPPVYHYFSYLWSLLTGSEEFAVRYVSVFAGMLVVAATYALGRRLAGGRVGIIGATLVALAPFAVHYSQEARPYIFALLWGTLAVYLLLRAVQSPPDAKLSPRLAWVGYVVMSFLSAFTLYSTALWFGAHGLILLVRRNWRRHFPTWLGVEAGVLALAVPWLLFFGRAIAAEIEVQGSFTMSKTLALHTLIVRAVSGLLAGITLPEMTTLALSGLLIVVGVAGVLMTRRRPGTAVAILTALVLVPVIGLYPIHTRLPWFEPRVLAFCAVPVYLLLAIGIDGWWSRGVVGLVGACAVIAVVWGFALSDYYFHFERYSPMVEDYRPLLAHVQEHARPGDIVLYKARWNVGYFEAYYQGPELDFRPLLPASLGQIAEKPRQVWVVALDVVRQPGGETPEDEAEDILSASAFKAEEAWFGRIRLARYAIPPQDTVTRRFVGATFERGLVLNEFTIQPDLALSKSVLVVEPGQAIYLTLFWQAGQPLDLAYNVFSHIIGPFNPSTGNPVWAQHDGVPGNQERPTTGWAVGESVIDKHVMWVDAAAPAGDYLLEVGMYDPGTGERLKVAQPDGAQSDHVILASVRVIAP